MNTESIEITERHVDLGPTSASAAPPDGVKPVPAAQVRKRSGALAAFNPDRISSAIERAFRADQGIQRGSAHETMLIKTVASLTEAVCRELTDLEGIAIDLETIQDTVEQVLMRAGHYSVARKYIVYREAHARARGLREQLAASDDAPPAESGTVGSARRTLLTIPLDEVLPRIAAACEGLAGCDPSSLIDDLAGAIYPGITDEEIESALILAARCRIEREPNFSWVAARLLLDTIYREVFGIPIGTDEAIILHRTSLEDTITLGVSAGRLAPDLLDFNIPKLAEALRPERDFLFQYMGIKTLVDRYLLHDRGRRFETPQFFWMRVAMGLALNEKDRERWAITFYDIMSSFYFVSSTPTLFNSGTCHPQLSSCFLTTFPDDLAGIFKGIADNAKLSKWAGGLGNDWTPVRALGAHIQGTNGESQGVIPFLKVANAAAVAVNQGGKRQGAVCAYLETWHLDIEEFLDLRKNSGDERRRTHDMNTANWIPDLFLKRVSEGGRWTLFSPDEVPDLHDLCGAAFERRYTEYEAAARAGLIRRSKTVVAGDLWRKMISMLYETGHPWMTFKDPCNVRSPQDHRGVVHSSNLCTEITLNTGAGETAVCNLGSINLAAMMTSRGLDPTRLAETVSVAVRMLDNVIDINFYPTPEAAASNRRHRPIGLGVMGFQECLSVLGFGYGDPRAVEFADESMEAISFHAILASAKLAAERGRYESFEGSKWDRGLLPIDTIDLLEHERGETVLMDRTTRMEWAKVRATIAQYGMRNSNVLAIAPTATIANIVGVTPSIEPTYRNLYVKANLSGDFTVVNPALVADLRREGLWDESILNELKHYDGSVLAIERIPPALREKYRTAFEIDPKILIEAASRRQKWIDMAQSLNLYVTTTSGRALSEMYLYAWKMGLKTTYYLRSQAATQVEKSALDVNAFGIQPRWMKNRSASSESGNAASCAIDDPTCEGCQ